MNKILKILLCITILYTLTSCNKEASDISENENIINESFDTKIELQNGRTISSTFDIPYNNSYLFESLKNNEITIDEYINKLTFISGANDGGSKLYKYSSIDKIFGDYDFYTIVCNSYNGIKDIFISKNINSLTNICVKN